MPNTSGKEFDRRYNNRRKSNEEDYYSNVHFQYQDNFNQIYRNSSRDKKNIPSFQSSSSDMKQPLRSIGDWSEFLSSNGKIYFYNRKTERAQWDKPDEWDWLIMQEEKGLSKTYYQQSSKDNRGPNRFRNKYENSDIFDSNVKSQRYNNYEKYQRDYSSDYINSNQSNTFRQNYNISDRYSNQNVVMQNFSHSNSVQINDYYDSSQNYSLNVSSSTSNSDYYTKNNPMYRNNNNYHNKDWSKMQYIQNGGNNLNSPNNAKNSPRYPNQYDDSNINKPYAYQQNRPHMSRYDTYSENNVNNQKYNYNHSNNSSNNSSYQNIDYNNFNNSNNNHVGNTANNNQSSNINKSNNSLNKDNKFVQSANNQSSLTQVSHNQSRSRTNSENTGFSPTNKKFKRSEENSQSRNVDDESWDSVIGEKSNSEINNKEQKPESQTSYETETKQEVNQIEKIEETINSNVKTEIEESKENQVEQKNTDPILTSTVDDINKYYRSEFVDRLTNCLGVVENFSWINQTYSKHFLYSKLSMDIKNYRSIVRVKEIKKTQQEQRLLFLQNQMKEIEELLG